MDCIVADCVRDASTEFCKKHQLAKENIDSNFSQWQHAYGSEFTRQEYLTRLAEDDEVGAGIWVIEVAEYLLTEEKL